MTSCLRAQITSFIITVCCNLFKSSPKKFSEKQSVSRQGAMQDFPHNNFLLAHCQSEVRLFDQVIHYTIQTYVVSVQYWVVMTYQKNVRTNVVTPLFLRFSIFFSHFLNLINSHFLNIINNSNMVLELVHIGVGYALKLTNINSNAIHNRCRHSTCQCHHHPIICDVFICICYHFRPMLQPLSDHSSCSLAIVCC